MTGFPEHQPRWELGALPELGAFTEGGGTWFYRNGCRAEKRLEVVIRKEPVGSITRRVVLSFFSRKFFARGRKERVKVDVVDLEGMNCKWKTEMNEG